MAHPLNRPRFGVGVKKDVVVEGYGILQPRVGLNLPSVGRFGLRTHVRRRAGHRPVHPRRLGRLPGPAGRRLLRGQGHLRRRRLRARDARQHAREPHSQPRPDRGLLRALGPAQSDVQLLEDTPSRYSADMARPPSLGAWRLATDRLAASSPARVAGITAQSAVDAVQVEAVRQPAPQPRAHGADRAGGARLGPAARAVHVDAAHHRDRRHRAVRSARHGLGARAPINWFTAIALAQAPDAACCCRLLQLAHTLACLPTEAVATLDAIARTMWRMVRGRRLLEWDGIGRHPRRAIRPARMDGVARQHPWLVGRPDIRRADRRPARPRATLGHSSPRRRLLLLWFFSPLVVWWADRPLAQPRSELSATQRKFLRGVARRTWAFFETFVGPVDNHLPPDNVQLHPVARVAHRTSPTNIGFSLLANLTAHDSGFITLDQMLTRIADTVTTMEKLERHRGHFYNWYDTQSLLPAGAALHLHRGQRQPGRPADDAAHGAAGPAGRDAVVAAMVPGHRRPAGADAREPALAGTHLAALDRADKLVATACAAIAPPRGCGCCRITCWPRSRTVAREVLEGGRGRRWLGRVRPQADSASGRR